MVKVGADSADAEVTTMVGSGRSGYRDGSAEDAMFHGLSGVCMAQDGTLIIADTGNHRIRQVRQIRDGSKVVVSTIAGPTRSSAHPAEHDFGYRDGKGLEALFHSPESVTATPDGRILVADTRNNAIRILIPPQHRGHNGSHADSSTWLVQTVIGHDGVAGFEDGIAQKASLCRPISIACLANGSLVVTDSGNHCLRLVHPNLPARSENRVRLDAANDRWYGYGQISGDQISEAPQRALIGSPIRSPNGTNAGIARAIDDAEQEEHWEEQRWPSSAVDAMRMLERENLSLVEENKRLRGLLALAADRIEQQGAEIGRIGLGA
eukprot:g1248.t1